ncbi:hypothetical protein O181_062951 [Austropuccinia psidii MF-1]|uniref:Uncharacterized protein n=1 Tax=Austropuccinia psidii MF-1 TaxID=1389203 RepID=A0A9Q3EQS4_9BASI|nr:hypothetical protein [Austropuccinia psidii MF-1]
MAKLEVPEKNEELRFEEINSEYVQEMQEEQEISGLYEAIILEVQERQENKEVKFGKIPNMEEYSSIEKGLEYKKDSKAKGKGPTSEEELGMEEEINNQINCKVNIITPEE